MTQKPSKKRHKLIALRKRMKLTQEDFWAALGVTQSCGSRYESGSPMPRTVKILLRQYNHRA